MPLPAGWESAAEEERPLRAGLGEARAGAAAADPVDHDGGWAPRWEERPLTKYEQRGLDAVVQRSHALVQSGQDAQDATVAYIHREPVKSVLIAAAAGATLMAVVTLLARRN